jgi:hypothetical protein
MRGGFCFCRHYEPYRPNTPDERWVGQPTLARNDIPFISV